MKTYDLALVAGVETRLTIDYNFFLILDDGGFPLNVSVFKGSGFQQCEGVSGGFGLRLNQHRGKEFIFTSANTQNIKIFVGDDEAMYQRLSGTVTINGTPNVFVTPASILGGILSTIKTVEDGVTYGANFRNNLLQTAGAVIVIVAPAANVNGLIVHDANMLSYASSTNPMVALMAKTSTPASIIDGEIFAVTNNSSGVANYSSGKLNRPVRIDAGKGLYFYHVTAETSATGVMKQVLYTLL